MVYRAAGLAGGVRMIYYAWWMAGVSWLQGGTDSWLGLGMLLSSLSLMLLGLLRCLVLAPEGSSRPWLGIALAGASWGMWASLQGRHFAPLVLGFLVTGLCFQMVAIYWAGHLADRSRAGFQLGCAVLWPILLCKVSWTVQVLWGNQLPGGFLEEFIAFFPLLAPVLFLSFQLLGLRTLERSLRSA